jgi:hypothetical protein
MPGQSSRLFTSNGDWASPSPFAIDGGGLQHLMNPNSNLGKKSTWIDALTSKTALDNREYLYPTPTQQMTSVARSTVPPCVFSPQACPVRGAGDPCNYGQ